MKFVLTLISTILTSFISGLKRLKLYLKSKKYHFSMSVFVFMLMRIYNPCLKSFHKIFYFYSLARNGTVAWGYTEMY